MLTLNSAYDELALTTMAATVDPPEPVVLLTPTGLTALSTRTTLTVSWDAVSNAVSYSVQWRPDGQAWSSADREVTVTGQTSVILTALDSGTTYQLRVRAEAGGDVSQWSDPPIEAETVDLPLETPTLQVNPGDGTVIADWNEIAGATHYEIQWATNAQDFGAVSRLALPTLTSYSITGLPNGVEQRVRVRAHEDSARTSDWSAVVGTTPTADPVDPVLPPVLALRLWPLALRTARQ